MAITIDLSKCTACGECTEACPVEAISQDATQDNKACVDGDTCVDCGACVDTCPVSAIEL